ncbi:MAG TPA: DMT family transporter [Pseudolabrys sp.]|nr:DMT family transporter [Pseudolabrys sp.]
MTNPGSVAPNAATRPLDAVAAAIVVALCLSWGFNQVAIKVAIHDVPPLIQAAARSGLAALIVTGWAWLRRIPLFARDGTLIPGVVAGVGFAIEFILIYRGMLYTTATRAVLFIYLAPFFVVIGARFVLPVDRFSLWQWSGLALSFAGMLVAFGAPTPALDPRQALGDVMMIGGAAFWAMTTLIIKASALNKVSSEKVMLYQLVVSAPLMALAAYADGERVTGVPHILSWLSLGYQTLYVVPITFVIWFALIVRYSASRLSAFTFLTPLFGVAAGALVLGEPLTPGFAAAVVLVAAGLIVVNRAR